MAEQITSKLDNVAIPSALRVRLKLYCVRNGLKMREATASAIEQYLQDGRDIRQSERNGKRKARR